MTQRIVSALDKSFPEALVGSGITSLSAPLAEFSTPLFAIDGAALEHNIAAMAEWTRERGLELMPHGKTTMSPVLWQKQLDAGATGITVATGWQANVALDAGIQTVQIANACTDPQLLRGVARRLAANAEQEVVSWVDSLATIDRMEAALPAGSRIGVLVELGATGGRTGARSLEEVSVLAERVAASAVLQLRGVAGYEGAIAHGREPASLAAVRAYCDRLVEALALVGGNVNVNVSGEPWITAGGSAFFDVVAESFAEAPGRRILRSGAYIVHDDGFYRSISPLDRARTGSDGQSLTSAMCAYARVVSTPEPGLALLDAGKRDFPFDEGLPVPLGIAANLGDAEQAVQGEVTAMNDQHTFFRWEGSQVVSIGDVVRLGLSHPCTAFDKWRLIPILEHEGAARENPRVVSAIETFF